MPAVVTYICNTVAEYGSNLFTKTANNKIVGFALAQNNSELTRRDFVSYAKRLYLYIKRLCVVFDEIVEVLTDFSVKQILNLKKL